MSKLPHSNTVRVCVCVSVCDREKERWDLRRWGVCCYSSKLNEGLTVPNSMHRENILLHENKMFHWQSPYCRRAQMLVCDDDDDDKWRSFINVQKREKKKVSLSAQTRDEFCVEFCVWQPVTTFFYTQNEMKYKRHFPFSLALHRLNKLRRHCVSFSARLSEWRAHWSLTDGCTSTLGFAAVPGARKEHAGPHLPVSVDEGRCEVKFAWASRLMQRTLARLASFNFRWPSPSAFHEFHNVLGSR